MIGGSLDLAGALSGNQGNSVSSGITEGDKYDTTKSSKFDFSKTNTAKGGIVFSNDNSTSKLVYIAAGLLLVYLVMKKRGK